MSILSQAKKALHKHKNPQKGIFLQRFFKTGSGEYAEGDKFLGITVPVTRSIAKQFMFMDLKDVFILLESEWHEERLMALEILTERYAHAAKMNDSKVQNAIYHGYLKRVPKFVNNWDLVDGSAHYIVGPHLDNSSRNLIHKLSKSKNLWEKRVAMISTFYYIRKNEFKDALKVAEALLTDSHDLIHKAVGWMLREIGNRAPQVEKNFLDKFASQMPRTTLRYAIEKLPESERKKYLAIKRQNIVK